MAASQGKSVTEVASQGLLFKNKNMAQTRPKQCIYDFSNAVFFYFPRSWTCVYRLPRSPFEAADSSVLVGNLLSYVDYTWFG